MSKVWFGSIWVWFGQMSERFGSVWQNPDLVDLYWWSIFSHIVSVHPSQKQANMLQHLRQGPVNKTTNNMSENNENILAVAWWVILNTPDLLLDYSTKFTTYEVM